MSWDDGLLEDQKKAAAHVGNHARILAGPGTGKTLTLTRHVCFLVADMGIDPNRILAFTFTRAAARELAQRVASELGGDRSPRISTLHSFALRQLLQNEAAMTTLPKPLRIADDWEERNIVLEDLKDLLELSRLREARDLLNELSADWQTLTADETDWEKTLSRCEIPWRMAGASEFIRLYAEVGIGLSVEESTRATRGFSTREPD